MASHYVNSKGAMLTRKYFLSIQTHKMASAAYAQPIKNDVFAVNIPRFCE